ncbi:MAG: hypothetical protein IT572_04320 [Deltaproteobacteria bacterium]|nr:hypothetical protein [Deltaproteobacteria bacterium]
MVDRLSAELIRSYPALSAFRDYVREHLHREPSPEDIVVVNEVPEDGKVHLWYETTDGNIFQAEIDARATHDQLILGWSRHRGHGSRATPVREPEFRNVADVCRTVSTLGGEAEHSLVCPETPSSTPLTAPSAEALAVSRRQFMIGNYLGAEALLWIARRLWRPNPWFISSPTGSLLHNFRPWVMTPAGTNELTFTQRLSARGPGLAAGAVAMVGSQYLADALGWHPNYHHEERFALGAGLTQLVSHGVPRLMIPRPPTPVLDLMGAARPLPNLEYTRALAARNARLASRLPSGFGNRLLTAALVDATLGRLWEEGSTERNALRMGSFFLPDVYRMAFGSRALGIAETRGARFLGRWGGRIMMAGFVADVGYMGIHHLTSDSTARDNAVYRRANELEDLHRSPWSWAAHGLASFVAPSLAERWVGSRYVDDATRELDANSSTVGSHATGTLRHSLLLGPGGAAEDASFYRELNWDWLRGENRLENIRTADGRSLPMRSIAEQLSDPEIFRREVELGDHERLVVYIQHQFRGHRLSREDVEECLTRISLYRVRANLAELRATAAPAEHALVDCFDENGALIAGREENLLRALFPEETVSAEQVLALRRVALTRHLIELRAASTVETPELAAYTRVAHEIGLIDERGEFVDSEETRLARSTGTSELPSLPTRVSPAEMMLRLRDTHSGLRSILAPNAG